LKNQIALNEYRNDFMKAYMKDNKDASETDAQKAFDLDYDRQLEIYTFKRNMVNHLVSKGMDEEEVNTYINAFTSGMGLSDSDGCGDCEGCDDCGTLMDITGL
jgi:hypothetical protein